MDERPLPKHVAGQHHCQATGRSTTFLLYLTRENVYRGKCPLCGMELEQDLTTSLDTQVAPPREAVTPPG